MALRAGMRKTSSGPSPEALLSQLSGYSHTDAHGLDAGRSEASRILGERCGHTSGMKHVEDTSNIYVVYEFINISSVVLTRSALQCQRCLLLGT